MSLRKIHKDTERGPSQIGVAISAIFSRKASPRPVAQPQMLSQRMPHERRLITPKKFGGAQRMRKDVVLIAVIAVVAIAAIAFEFTLMGKPGEPPAPVNQTGNTTNQTNQTNQTQPVVITKPDLSIQSFTVSKDRTYTSEPLAISATYENRGKADVNKTVIQFFVGSTLIKEEQLNNLTQGKSGEISFEWTPKDADVGQRILKVMIDPKNAADEESEANNQQTKSVEVILNIVKDVSDSFKFKTVVGVGGRWYSDKYGLPPKSGPDMTYFVIYQETPGVYLLDVGAAGFRASRSGTDIYAISIPDASSDGWNGGTCIRQHEEGADCIWTGPEVTLTISFKGSDIVVTDQSSVKSRASTTKKKVDSIELVGMTIAKWPEKLKTFKILGAESPNEFVPSEFYTIKGNMIFINPMMWNPATEEAKVATAYSFRITLK